MNESCKSVTQIPTLLRTLTELTRFRLGTHLNQEEDRLRLEVRKWSKDCLRLIQCYGDADDQSELVNIGYGRAISLSFYTAGGIGEGQDAKIEVGLNYIWWFLRELHEGRNNYPQPSFRPLPLLARRTEEQIEEQGANEEIEAQMKNNGLGSGIKDWANGVKANILNRFIHNNRI
ncbi:MAG: hypothetical protein EZS28_014358 [Streblomastix strix]|uniref:Uncharacterized protein n=1 Tax=Streblomastix strix TaxID=222440 RepID=A0A5J4W6L4_9EUKA|nr:MAG: hypothetical protein EZS28_014358 [Streblomastix strix]